MKKITIIILVVLAAIFASYFLWSASGRTAVAAEPEPFLDDISSYGSDQDAGNLVGVQTYMEPADYANGESYRAKLNSYLATADAQGWLQPDTIVVFPEQLGTWLVAANEKSDIYEAETIEEALQLMVISNLPEFIEAYSQAEGEDKIRDSLFRMKADTMAQIHQETLAGLAEQYGVTIVAGSLFLPEPKEENGRLVPGEGALQSVTPVFASDGTLYPNLIHKAFITHDESPFIASGATDQQYTFETPAGDLAVLICADSWYLEPYDTLAVQQPEVIVVPNAYFDDWDKPWGGHDPGPVPGDVNLADIGRITEGEARIKYTLDGRMQDTGAVTGMHVFFRGNIWDLNGQGHTILFTEEGTIEASPEAHGALINYWLPETE